MPDKKSIDSRRKLLKSLAAGGGAIIAGKSLPDSWSRPVVSSVILPAHAQTSAAIYASDLGVAVSSAICVTALGGVADITAWFEVGAGADLSEFTVSGVPIGPAGFTAMNLAAQSCGFADSCQVSCVSVNGTAVGQIQLTLEGGTPGPVTDYSAPLAACITPPAVNPAGCPLTQSPSLRSI